MEPSPVQKFDAASFQEGHQVKIPEIRALTSSQYLNSRENRMKVRMNTREKNETRPQGGIFHFIIQEDC
jgi:hypothetical protein